MKKVLVVLGHSNYENSLSNKIIADAVEKHPNVTVRKLHEVSTDYVFDVAAEQAALEATDVIVFQFPFHWYALPALFKKWVDDVLAFGFAYGPDGSKLAGKKLVLSFTTGGPKEAYQTGGDKGFTTEQFAAPLIQTAGFCSMEYAGLVDSNGMLYIPGMMGDKDEVSQKAADHAERLLAHLESL